MASISNQKNFIIRSDHQPLKFLFDQKLSTPSKYTWLAKLIPYDYEIKYKHGKINVVTDTLSRITSTEVILQAFSNVTFDLMERIQISWEKDQNCIILLRNYNWEDL